MLSKKISLLIFLLISVFTVSAQLYLPNESYYNGEIERIYLKDTNKTFYQSHQNFKPVLDKKTNTKELYKNDKSYYYWITQKLFKENFLIFKGDDFWCSVDPVLDLEMGKDFALDSTVNRLYWNTRGIRIQAKFFDKIAFTTTFYENQAFVPDYQAAFFKQHGEFYPNVNTGTYNQQNAVIPGYARTKPFKVDGFDFAFAEGNISLTPNDWFHLQMGNGNHFIGNGYRSLLLSDFSFNYPYIKPEFYLWDGRIQYTWIYSSLQNLYRLPYFTTTEATYENKIGTFHYIDISITKNLQLGLFEGAIWKHTDSLGSQNPDFFFLNPVYGLNTIVKGKDEQNFNSILGFNLAYQLKNTNFYSQAVIAQKTLGAYQFGFKSYDIGIEKLDIRMEYNYAKQNNYLSQNKRMNYSHYNLPLAHPYTNGFQELIFEINYQWKDYFFQNRTIYSSRFENDSISLGNQILQAISTENLSFSDYKKVFYNQFEYGYRMNKNYNLQVFAGFIFRNEMKSHNYLRTEYVYFGIRTRLRNKTLDW